MIIKIINKQEDKVYLKKNLKLFFLITALAFFVLITGCGKSEEQKVNDTMNTSRQIDSTLIRKHNVDVASLDANGDGKVFQCPMDWEVISDEPGNCPICKMALEEFLVEEAQKNLERNK